MSNMSGMQAAAEKKYVYPNAAETKYTYGYRYNKQHKKKIIILILEAAFLP